MDGTMLLGLSVISLLIPFFSVAAAHKERRFWKKCRRSESRIQLHQQITMGKSHLR